MTILSASRRTDIPAFYADWFINRIKEGYVLYPLPKSDKLKYLELTPEKIDCIVFWSKNYENLIPKLELLDNHGYEYYFHFTINNYPASLESKTVKTEKAIEQLKQLADHKSPDHVLWRYDPIITTKDLNTNYHLYNFELLASKLQHYTKRSYFEFVDLYKKVERNFNSKDINYVPLSEMQKHYIVNAMAKIAQNYDMEFFSCCNDIYVSDLVKKARCIDPDLVNKFTGRNINYKIAPTRDICGCAKSVDIGEYGSCLHGCLYCYANESITTAQSFYKNFDQSLPALDKEKLNKPYNQQLIKPIDGEDKQLQLF